METSRTKAQLNKPGRNLIGSLLAGVISLSGCQKGMEIQNPSKELESSPIKEGLVQGESRKTTSKEEKNRCELFLNDLDKVITTIVDLRRQIDNLDTDKNKSLIEKRHDLEPNVDANYTLDYLSAKEDEFKTLLIGLSYCESDEARINSWLQTLTKVELIILIEGINAGANEGLEIDLKGEKVGIEITKPELSEAQVEPLLNSAFEIVLTKSLNEKEIMQLFFSLISYPQKSFLNKENILKLKEIFLKNLKEKPNVRLIQESLIFSDIAPVLFEILENTKDQTVFEEVILCLGVISKTDFDTDLKLRKYFYDNLKNPKIDNNKKLFILKRMSNFFFQFSREDEAIIPTLIKLMKIGPNEISVEASLILIKAKDAGLIAENKAKEMAKYLLERSKEKGNKYACDDIASALELDKSLTTSEGTALAEELCKEQ